MQYNDEQKQMIQEIVDYIAKLPVGTVITIMGVMEKIFPDKKDEISESHMYMGVDLFDVHFAVLDLLKKQGIELDASDSGDSCGGLPYLYSLEIIDEQSEQSE